MKIIFTFLFVGVFSLGALHAATLSSHRFEERKGSGREQSGAGSPKVIYISPLLGSKYVTPGSNIIIRANVELNSSTARDGLFNVVGSSSGKHDGKVILSDDQRTVLFQPAKPFSLGEIVSVSMAHQLLSLGGDTISVDPFSFTISGKNLNADKSLIEKITKAFSEVSPAAAQILPSVSKTGDNAREPKLKDEFAGLPTNFPPLTPTASDSPTAGYIFLSTLSSPVDSSYGHFLIIADDSGNPVFYRHLSDQPANEAWDFNLQSTGVLTYAYPFADPTWYVMNTSFQVVDSFRCGNGYIDNGHSMRILPNGNVVLLADDYEQMNLSKVVSGGDTDATVHELVIQELDRNKNVIFQWRTIDHFNLTDGLQTVLTGSQVDPFHCNAVEMDEDGNILLSSRYLCEITKIDIETGDIIWRLGGKNNQFKFVNDPIGFTYQHNIRRLPNGDITLLDNGNLHDPAFSRAVEYKLDEIDKTATLVWQFTHKSNVYASFMGSVQRLNDGNTLIGWGGAPTPAFTEVRPDGTIALEMAYPYDDVVSYRAYCFPFLFITSPSSNDTVQARGIATLKWNSAGVDTVDIDCSTDGGISWVSQATNYPANRDSISLSIPTTSGSTISFRIIESGEWDKGVSFVSDPITVNNAAGVKSPPNPYSYSLSENYPNPFNPSTVIDYEVASNSLVTLKVYDVLGREIEALVNEARGPGKYSVTFDGSKLASGVYFYRMIAGDYVSTRKALLVK